MWYYYFFFQDALKLVRRDRTLVGNTAGLGNGFTII